MNDGSLINSVRRRWWVVVIFAALGAALGYLPEPAEVEEQATSFVATNTALTNGGGDNSIISPSQVTLLATTGEVPRRVDEQIGYAGNSAELAAEIEVNFDFESGALTISTTQDTAARAEEIANTFADVLNGYLAERQDTVYQDRLAASRQRLDELEAELTQVSEQLTLAPEDPLLLAERDAIAREYGLAFEQNRALEVDPGQLSFTTIEAAQAVPEVDRGLSAPASRSTRALMGLVIGTVLGIGIAVLLARLDRKIRSREQAEALVSMRARASIPQVRKTVGGVVVTDGRHDPLSDSYRTLRNVVSFVQHGLELNGRAGVTAVVSPGPGDGKTSVTANLAAAFVEQGQRTIAVNTDFRRPRLHEAMIGVPASEPPFSLEELDDVPRRALPLDVVGEKLRILDLSGLRAAPGQLVRSSLLQVDRLAPVSDQIVIDTSPVGATAEVLEILPSVDVIVLVTRVGHTSIKACQRTIDILRDISTAPIVFALTGVRAERNPYYEYTRRPAGTEPEAPAKPLADELTVSE